MWLEVEELRAVLDLDEPGQESFAGMIDYAAGAGWLSEDRTEVRALIEE